MAKPARELCSRIARAFPGGHPHGHVLAAVSGGADSMALLMILSALRAHRDFRLTAAYVDHGTRYTAVVEAALVCGLATRLGAGFEFERTCSSLPTRARTQSEERLRKARYEALARAAARCRADWLVTAHTRDDQIETILLRLFRGAGRTGLSAMRPARGALLRPLLDVGRNELRSELHRLGICWIEDPTNRDPRHARNRVRSSLVPMIQATLGAGSLAPLPAMARTWVREDAFLDSEAERFLAFALRSNANNALDLAALSYAPSGLRPRILRRWLIAAGARPSRLGVAQVEAVERMLASTEGSAETHVAGIRVLREYEIAYARPLTLEPIGAGMLPAAIRVDRHAVWSHAGGCWRLEIEPSPAQEAARVTSPYRQIVDFARVRLRPPVVLRLVQPGDVIRIKGGGRKKVRDIMADVRLPRRLRRAWPLLTAGGEVVWVPGLAVAADMESGGMSTTERVRFSWRLDAK